jgi:eukaryotic-like serine/threonine-protein kinase
MVSCNAAMTSNETSNDPNIGRVLANRYQLVAIAGRGAMGKVYRAEDILLGGVIAVKFLDQTLLNPKMRDRFYAEARTCAQLGQRTIHIVRVTDYGADEQNGYEIPFYIMEFLDGSGLGDIINTKPIPLPRFLHLAEQICLGLQCAHEGITQDGKLCPIIHRDIKPSNVLVINQAGIGELVKVLDFGISKLLQEDSGQTSSFMGTLAYSSPEQMEGKPLDARSDIYSLGVMLFEMLTGRLPLRADTHSFGSWYRTHHFQVPRPFLSVNPSLKLPRSLENLVMSCLAKSPDDRPQSITEILHALEPLGQRYSATQQITDRISKVLQRQPSVPEIAPHEFTLADEIDRQSLWPSDKPVAQIAFPKIMATSKGNVAALWVMLPSDDIRNFQRNQLYNKIYKNFLCTLSPHPMLLWVTAIHNEQRLAQGWRWLPGYLDLKTVLGRDVIRLIADQEQYHIVLFALESPRKAGHVMTISIHPSQANQLKQWSILSQSQSSVGPAGLSKDLLKSELDKLKQKLEEEAAVQ